MKRIALFLDGTWNDPEDNTSVWRLKLMVADEDASEGGATRVLKSSDGTPLMATDSAGDTVWGPLEPFGRDWQEGSASGALNNGLFLRLPGQWDEGRWRDAASAAGMYYNSTASAVECCPPGASVPFGRERVDGSDSRF